MRILFHTCIQFCFNFVSRESHVTAESNALLLWLNDKSKWITNWDIKCVINAWSIWVLIALNWAVSANDKFQLVYGAIIVLYPLTKPEVKFPIRLQSELTSFHSLPKRITLTSSWKSFYEIFTENRLSHSNQVYNGSFIDPFVVHSCGWNGKIKTNLDLNWSWTYALSHKQIFYCHSN